MISFKLTKDRVRPDIFENDDISKSELIIPGMPVSYYVEDKNIGVRQAALESYKLGIVLDAKKDTVTVLYKGFLQREPFIAGLSGSSRFIQYDIKAEYKSVQANIIKHMPSIKKLKRLNIRLLDRNTIDLFKLNFDKVMSGYANFFGDDACFAFKETLLTSEIYVYDNEHFLLYSFHDDKFYIPTLEHNIGRFLCYFTFKI